MANDPVIIEIDFTGITPASGGLARLDTGFYQGPVGEVKLFQGTGGPDRVAVYVDVSDKGRVRESFNADIKGAPFILSVLISAGVTDKSPDKKVKLDMGKLVGKVVYFHYTAPPPKANESDRDGYAKFRFLPKAQYERERDTAKAIKPTVKSDDLIPDTKGANKATVETTVTSDDGDELPF